METNLNRASHLRVYMMLESKDFVVVVVVVLFRLFSVFSFINVIIKSSGFTRLDV